MRRPITMIAIATLALAACSTNEPGAKAGEVTFDIAAIEIKGATSGIAAPEIDPTGLSTGYRYKAPGVFDESNPARWEVATYLYSPGAMTVVQGDMVTLRFFGVNGDEHVQWVQGPDGTPVTDAVTLLRGRELIVEFTADQMGHYRVICSTHAPTMTADILSVSG